MSNCSRLQLILDLRQEGAPVDKLAKKKHEVKARVKTGANHI